MTTLTMPSSLSLPASMGGDSEIYDLVAAATIRGATTAIVGTTISVFRVDDSLLSIARIRSIVGKGADASGFQCYFRLDDITDTCPFSDSNQTWETWGVYGNSHAPIQIGEYWYRSSCVGASGEPLLASVWVAVDGLHVITAEEFVSLGED